MKTLRIIYHLARADFLERARRYGFLVTLAAALFLGYQVVIGTVGMDLGDYRGVYNSAWVGMMMAMTSTIFVSLIGFYIVKNSVERDRCTGVGQILAATPISRVGYLLGKWISNFVVLAAILALLLLCAVVVQWWRGDESRLDIAALFLPFLLIAVPAMAGVAAWAIFFETVPGLRSGFGNVAWFFLWSVMLAIPVANNVRWLDMSAISTVKETLGKDVRAHFPEYKGSFSIGGGPRRQRPYQTFVWNGMRWTPLILAQRLGLFAFGAALVLAGSMWFDRFDSSRRMRLPQLRQTTEAADSPQDQLLSESAAMQRGVPPGAHLKPLAAMAGQHRFLALVQAELKLMLKGRNKLWYVVLVGLWIASVAAPLENSRAVVLPLCWLWPVLVWSAMGAREAQHATNQLVFSAARVLPRQLSALWTAGVAVSVLTGGLVALRLLFAGDWGALGAWVAGAAFVPSLALALGAWSGTGKVFEGIYTALWYIGPMNHVPQMDYVGATRAAISSGMPLVYLALSAALIAAAFAGRRRQMHIA
jgi:hypothetical protein